MSVKYDTYVIFSDGTEVRQLGILEANRGDAAQAALDALKGTHQWNFIENVMVARSSV